MLKISPDQYAAFEKKAHDDYEEELVKHLKTFAPAHAAGMGDVRLRALIQSGLAKARKYEFTVRGALRFYVECQIMFGHEFDTDPMLPWAVSSFPSKAQADELAQVDAIHASVMQYRKEVFGPEDALEAAAIKRLLAKPAEVWLAGDLSDGGIARWWKEVYPEKARLAPPDALKPVLARSQRAVESLGLQGPGSKGVLATLMLAFGHGVLSDPQFFWVTENLLATVNQSSTKRIESLATRFLAYLAEGLSLLEKR